MVKNNLLYLKVLLTELCANTGSLVVLRKILTQSQISTSNLPLHRQLYKAFAFSKTEVLDAC
jgi:hypothetical protein